MLVSNAELMKENSDALRTLQVRQSISFTVLPHICYVEGKVEEVLGGRERI